MTTETETKPEAPHLDTDVSLLVAQAGAMVRLLRCGIDNHEDEGIISDSLEVLIRHLDETQAVIDTWQDSAIKFATKLEKATPVKPATKKKGTRK